MSVILDIKYIPFRLSFFIVKVVGTIYVIELNIIFCDQEIL